MKKVLIVTWILLIACLLMVSCESIEEHGAYESIEEHSKNKLPKDKYTYYIKNYVGYNCYSVGYFIETDSDYKRDFELFSYYLHERTRYDDYGPENIKIKFIDTDGVLIKVEDDSKLLKKYRVIGQNIAPNTELKYIYEKDEQGNETKYVEWQNIEEIELTVELIE